MSTDQPRKRQAKVQPGPANRSEQRASLENEALDTSTDGSESTGVRSDIPVVGIGGSAGALGAFTLFFDTMPSDSGAAFVVTQHLAPAHESLLPELLAQHTGMRVTQAQDGDSVAPNCVFVIPPNHDLEIQDGVLHITEQAKHDGIRMPIDRFFRSLAEDRQERAICILFSGAGSDGTLGVRAVRGVGGMTIAQDPQSAQFAEMPRSAISTKLVDRVLPPDQIPEAVTQYLRHPYTKGGAAAALLETEGKTGGLDDILKIVRTQTNCDFRCYKKNTILRRIERRMGLRRVAEMAQYSDLLRREAEEVSELLKDLLINVTSFFRDPDAFEELRQKAIAPLVAAKQADEPLRVWVAGCSTGEEVYSLVMLLMEEMGTARKNFPLQVFATDIDEEALQFARQGLYPESVVADVGQARLAKYFVRKEQGYQIGEALRNAVVFASQNLITHPPFSKMDLLSCRNLLIYLDSETQAKLIPLFNFALNPGGVLFLGRSAGIGDQTDLFSVISKKSKIYRRTAPPRPIALDSPIMPGSMKSISVAAPPAARIPRADYADAVRHALLNHFTAAAVLVDKKGQILQFHGQTGKYLDLPAGDPNLNLLDIAKEGLALKLRLALRTASDERKTVVVDGVPITRDADAPCTRLTLSPLMRRDETELLLTVIFEDVSRPPWLDGDPTAGAEDGTTVRRLEDELKATQQDLQANITDLQASNEELRVSNEEVVSTNEELQSTNEELETSKEELQSVNEELTTINSQLQDKIARLDTSYSDMANLLKSTRIATLFLDSELRIKFFTPDTTRVLKLIASDTGRPLGDLSVNFVDYDLTADARAVAKGGPDIEQEARHADGSIYMVRIMPYRAQDDQVDGVVVTFDDVTKRKQRDDALRESKERYREQCDEIQSIYNSAHVGLCVFDRELRFVRINQRMAKINGIPASDHIGKTVDEVVPDLAATAKGMAERILRTGEAVTDIEISGITASQPGVQRTWIEQWLPLKDDTGQVMGINVVVEEITERKQGEQREREALALAAASQTAVNVLNAMGEGVVLLDMEGCITSINPALTKMIALSKEDMIGRPFRDVFSPLIAPEDRSRVEQGLHTALNGRVPDLQSITLLPRKGRRIPTIPSVTHVRRPRRKPTAIVITLRDISDISTMQQKLEASERKYRELVENANSIIIQITPDQRITFFNEYAQRFFGYTAEEVLGKSVIGTIVPPVDSEGRDLRKMAEAITTHPELHGSNDNENICKNGHRVWIHWSNRAIRDEHGTIREIMCVGVDMTERRKLEKKSDAYRQHLRKLADRLTTTEEQQRRRIATHIHDTVVQTLSLSTIRLGGVMAAVEEAGMDEQRETISGIRELLDHGTKECRGLMEALVPSLLYEVGLHAALTEFAKRQSKTVGANIHIDEMELIETIDDVKRGLLFQCARELICNAEKYAGPCEIRVSASAVDHAIQLRVQDNGRGFDPAELDGEEHAHADGGFGLFNIQERLDSMGGCLDLDSAPGKGTTATVWLPLPPS